MSVQISVITIFIHLTRWSNRCGNKMRHQIAWNVLVNVNAQYFSQLFALWRSFFSCVWLSLASCFVCITCYTLVPRRLWRRPGIFWRRPRWFLLAWALTAAKQSLSPTKDGPGIKSISKRLQGAVWPRRRVGAPLNTKSSSRLQGLMICHL